MKSNESIYATNSKTYCMTTVKTLTYRNLPIHFSPVKKKLIPPIKIKIIFEQNYIISTMKFMLFTFHLDKAF